MIEELANIVLDCDLREHGLRRGDMGTVVLCHGDAGYDVEFMTLDGETIAVVTLDSAQVRPVGRHEVPHARTVGDRF